MSGTTKSKPKQPGIPLEAQEHLRKEIEGMGIYELEGGVRGRYCYVTHAGDPLCRLGYRGSLEEWDFAIYRYSRGNYGELPLAPDRGPVAKMLRMALHAYNLR